MSACTSCGDEADTLLCPDCSRDAELVDVLEFFKQLDVDAMRCGVSLNAADIAARLERGEHRR